MVLSNEEQLNGLLNKLIRNKLLYTMIYEGHLVQAIS